MVSLFRSIIMNPDIAYFVIKKGFLVDNLHLFIEATAIMAISLVHKLPAFLNLGVSKPEKQRFILFFFNAMVSTDRIESFELSRLLRDSLLNYFEVNPSTLEPAQLLYDNLVKTLKDETSLFMLKANIDKVVNIKDQGVHINLFKDLGIGLRYE